MVYAMIKANNNKTNKLMEQWGGDTCRCGVRGRATVRCGARRILSYVLRGLRRLLTESIGLWSREHTRKPCKPSFSLCSSACISCISNLLGVLAWMSPQYKYTPECIFNPVLVLDRVAGQRLKNSEYIFIGVNKKPLRDSTSLRYIKYSVHGTKEQIRNARGKTPSMPQWGYRTMERAQ